MDNNSADRNPIDLLAEEFATRCRQGAAPSIEEYATKYPQWADDIRMLFPPVAMMEELKRKRSGAASSEPQLKRDIERIGDFKIVRELGRGGMGIVYEAQQLTLGRRVALKVLPRHSLLDSSRLQRFQREAQAAARLHHTNIVSVFGSGEADGLHYYAMELIDGKPLNEILERLRKNPSKNIQGDATRPPRGNPALMTSTVVIDPATLRYPSQGRPAPPLLPTPDADAKGPPVPAADSGAPYWRWVAQVGVQIAEALFYAHRQGTLHRDIKPANILLDTNGSAWITDFGLAKIAAGEDLTETGDLIGTLQYMAPEMFNGPAEARSDLYSLGLVLFEMLTLRLPFDPASAQRMIRERLEREPHPPRKFNPDIPRDLETVVLKAIAQDPAQRYAHAADLADDLRRFLDDRPVLARPVGVVERLVRWQRRNRLVAGLSAAVFLSLLLALAAGWIGYVQTTAALRSESARRADADNAERSAEANVQLCLQAFEQIFNQLEVQEHRPPGSPDEGAPPPPRPRDDGPGDNPMAWLQGHLGPGMHPPPPRDTKETLGVLQAVLSFYDKFSEKNETNTTLQAEAARAYGRIGELQQRMGETTKAEAAFQRAIKTAQRLHAAEPENRDYALLTARIEDQLAASYSKSNHPVDADKSFQEALSIEDLLARGDNPDERSIVDLARTRLSYSDFLLKQRRVPEAGSLAETTLNQLRSQLPNFPRLRPWIGLAWRAQADVYRALGDADGAAKADHEADTFPKFPQQPGGGRFPPPPPPN